MQIIESSAFWTAEDITIGLAALLACFEMVIFSVLHIKAFPYQPYRALAPSDGTAASQQRSTYRKTRRPRALLTVLNFADFGREIVEEIRFLCRGGRPGDELLEERRRDDFEAIMGQSRPRVKARTSDVQEELAKLDRLAAQGNLPVPLALREHALGTAGQAGTARSISEQSAAGTLAFSPPGKAPTESVTDVERAGAPRFVSALLRRLRAHPSVPRFEDVRRTGTQESTTTFLSSSSHHLPHITYRPASYQRLSFDNVPSPPPFALCRPEPYQRGEQLQSASPSAPRPCQYGRPLPPGAAPPILH